MLTNDTCCLSGLNAWPVAQTKLQDKIMRVWRAEVIDGSNSVTPGLILNDEKHIDVGTGGGVLRLLEIQIPGKTQTQSSLTLTHFFPAYVHK
jgi:methionyl-tRNA formyltransferase